MSSCSFYVYVLFRPNGFPCYVGKGTGNRWCDWDRGGNPHLRNIIAKAGGKLPSVIVRDDLTEAESFAVEVALIAAIGRKKDGGPLVNLTDGGEGVSGLRHSVETRAKISLIGKGRRHTAETRAKMAASHKGKKRSDEARANMRAAQKGRTVSEEMRARISRTLSGRGPPPEHMERLRLLNVGNSHTRGKALSLEHRTKIGVAHSGQKRSAEARKNMSAWQIGRKMSEEAVAKMSEAGTRRAADDDERKRLSEIGKLGAQRRWNRDKERLS